MSEMKCPVVEVRGLNDALVSSRHAMLPSERRQWCCCWEKSDAFRRLFVLWRKRRRICWTVFLFYLILKESSKSLESYFELKLLTNRGSTKLTHQRRVHLFLFHFKYKRSLKEFTSRKLTIQHSKVFLWLPNFVLIPRGKRIWLPLLKYLFEPFSATTTSTS